MSNSRENLINVEGKDFAYERTDNKSTIIVEYGDFYNEK